MFSNLKNDFIDQFIATTPPNLIHAKKEIEQWVKNFVSHWLSTHDLVTKEEFELQVKLLSIAQEKLKTMEEKLDHLSAQVAKQNSKVPS